MSCEKLFNEIDCLYEKYLDVWEDVCNIESPTEYKEGVDAVGRYFIKMAAEKGWKVDVCKQEVSGDAICITMNHEITEKPVSLSGHMDTVHPLGLFGNPPVHRDDTYIYGPGVNDCKGGLVAIALAMDALQKVGFNKRPIQFLLQSDEEKGSSPSGKATINYICEKAKDSVAFLNCEGLQNKSNFVIERKGILRYRFNITGKAAHSAKRYEGANAIAEAANKILQLEELCDPDGITCNCGLIEGGSAANSVAAFCTFVADVRVATVEQQKWIEKKMQEVADKTYIDGCTCELEQISSRPAMPRVDRNVELFHKINEIFKEVGLPVVGEQKTPGGSDAAYATLYGIPCVDSLATEGEGIHSINEKSRMESLREAAKRIAAIVYML